MAFVRRIVSPVRSEFSAGDSMPSKPKPPPWEPPYVYRAEIVGVHDGDTVTARVDVGFSVSTYTDLRLLGINAPELKSGKPGKDATEHLKGLLARYRIGGTDDVPVVVIKTKKDKNDSFGRMLAEIQGFDGDVPVSINELMIRDEFAVPYMV